MASLSKTKTSGHELLGQELERLKRILNVGHDLKVRWVPNRDESISGEVSETVIYLYDDNEEIALETLRHEFIDWAVSKVIEPYMEVTNRLISFLNERAYRQKEDLVEKISRLI